MTASSTAPAHETILVIDDETFMLEFCRRVLESAKYRVITAQTGEAGLRAYEQERCGLVITDLFMPDKDGLETIRDLLKEDPEAKIIAISGGGGSRFVQALRAAEAFGAKASLAKPFQPVKLLELVAKVLGRAAAK